VRVFHGHLLCNGEWHRLCAAAADAVDANVAWMSRLQPVISQEGQMRRRYFSQ